MHIKIIGYFWLPVYISLYCLVNLFISLADILNDIRSKDARYLVDSIWGSRFFLVVDNFQKI
ncbi:MAG: hypothetical protein AMK74_05105 [Nitrospira bacterium SM23_35]|nr:MAG: hypothetical protein AMK74_05105 [Nitrospira bacterium SM23_35]